MKLKTLRRAPIYIAAGVVGAVCLVEMLRLDFFERLEDMTYDWRVRQEVRHSPEVSTNLGFVSISDETIELVNKGMLERPYGLYWPRHIYGRVASELAAQGARAVAFDVLFPDLREDQAPLAITGQDVEPDKDFADRIRAAGNVILAAEKSSEPPKQFRTNALALGDITVNNDLDGVLRRTRAFRIYRKWHPAFLQIESDTDYAVDLSRVRIEPDKVVLLRPAGLPPIEIPLTNGMFDLKDFTERIPRGMERFSPPFTDERVWDMGIVLAAQELHLDLDNADVDFKKGRIILKGPGGITRVIPVDKDGNFYINWTMTVDDHRLGYEPFEGLLAQCQRREFHSTNAMVTLAADHADRSGVDWKGKLVVIGSEAVANDLTDRGPTPLSGSTILVSKHWNVASSILTGQFVTRTSLVTELALTILLGVFALVVTYMFRSYVASCLVLLACLAYVFMALQAYHHYRYWLPMVLPLGGALLTLHACLLVYLVFFEQLERHRLKAVFSKMVSPDVMNEVLKTEKLSGARRNVTVLFADIRGFTEMTDVNLERAAEFVKGKNLTGEAAEAVFDTQSRETLATVNLYLKVIAETVLKHTGTVDKFIGDCVMAYWGAPISNPKHALACVRAAIDVQRAIYRLNQEREEENRRREEENVKLASAGQPLLQPLPVLSIGSGVNTGVVTVGLMGSNERENYTVFGRDVNLASRLESYSGRGRIVISEATLAEIIQDDPSLALSCVELPAVHLKGFRTAIPVYEVPWREQGDAPAPVGEAAPSVVEAKPAITPTEAEVPYQGGAGGPAA